MKLTCETDATGARCVVLAQVDIFWTDGALKY